MQRFGITIARAFQRSRKLSQKIIIVDSEPVVRDVIQTILESDGYEVVASGDPNVVMGMLQEWTPALIITNVSLVGMTGHDAMHNFKTICPDVPVLMVSGLPDSDVIQQWVKEDGFDAFPKPFTAQQFKDKVHEVLARPQAAHG